MTRLNFIWKKKMGLYQQGDALYVNKIRLASSEWNSGRSQGDTDETTRWVGFVELPSLSDKSQRVYGSTPEEIKSKIEQVVTAWFNEALKGASDDKAHD